MIFMPQLTLDGNFFDGGKSAELQTFSTVSQVTRDFNLGEIVIKKYLFSEICATMSSPRGLGFMNRNFGEIFPGQRGLKNYFRTEAAKAAA